MSFLKLEIKIQVKETRDNTRERFYLCSSQVFFRKKFRYKNKISLSKKPGKKLTFSTEILHRAASLK